MIPGVVAGFTSQAGPSAIITLALSGQSRGYQSGAFGSASPLILPMRTGDRTLAAAFLDTGYVPANGFRLGFSTTYTDGPASNLFEYIDVEGIGRLLASDALWYSGQPVYTWAGVTAGTWTAAGQARRITFKV